MPFQQGFGRAEFGENLVFGHDRVNVLYVVATRLAFSWQLGLKTV